jgi:hypothetical protein
MSAAERSSERAVPLSGDAEPLRAAFNLAADKTRLLLLLSPT